MRNTTPCPMSGCVRVLTASARCYSPQVELAQATIWDMLSLRTEREHLRNVFRGGKGEAEKAYDPLMHDWAHKFPFSKSETLAVAWNGVNLARKDNLFYRPNVSALKARPIVNDFY